MHYPTENDRVGFWLLLYFATVTAVFVFAVVGRFVP